MFASEKKALVQLDFDKDIQAKNPPAPQKPWWVVDLQISQPLKVLSN